MNSLGKAYKNNICSATKLIAAHTGSTYLKPLMRASWNVKSPNSRQVFFALPANDVFK